MLGLGAALSQPAEARRSGSIAAGIAVGTLLGLGIAGAYAGPRYYGPADYGPGCYRGPAPVRLGRPQLLAQRLRRGGLPRRRVALLASDDLRLTRALVGSSRAGTASPKRRMAARCSAMAAAFDTLTLAMAPSVAMRQSRSQLSRVSWRRPLPSAPSTSAHAVRPGQRLDPIGRVPVEADHGDAELLQLGQRAREVLHQRDGHVLERARGGLGERARRAGDCAGAS